MASVKNDADELGSTERGERDAVAVASKRRRGGGASRRSQRTLYIGFGFVGGDLTASVNLVSRSPASTSFI